MLFLGLLDDPAGAARPRPRAFERPISWKQLIPNVASDQKKIWLLPLRVVRGNDLVPAGVAVGATAGLIALDPLDTPYFAAPLPSAVRWCLHPELLDLDPGRAARASAPPDC